MDFPRRKLPRLNGFDYSSENFYFVTLCASQHRHLFGSIDQLNQTGAIALDELLKIPSHYQNVRVDKYVIMPNHIHMIVVIGCSEKRDGKLPTLSSVIGLYKSGVSRRVHQYIPNLKLWQTSFYDHILRTNHSYRQAWKYIDENPAKWKLLRESDELYPSSPGNA